MINEPTNEDRIGRAGLILLAYAVQAESIYEGAATNITDLLADLMHYAASKDIDFQACLTTAQIHFNAETQQEDQL